MTSELRYLSVCSGIEAATVAWEPLGWTPVAFSEISAFPSAVLAHRWPGVPNLGDFTKIGPEDVGPIDLLVGGTPCQSFSIAGLRGGLADDRGNLALEFLMLAQRVRPRWVVWENVPGVLSSTSHAAPDPSPPPPPMDLECDGTEVYTEDEYDSEELHAFNCFLAGLSDVGYCYAYRKFDAQYFGLAQRRERMFVVGYLGDWRPPAAVLFEPQSLSWNSAPSREKREDLAPTISARPTAGGGLGTDFDLDGGLIANCLNAKGGIGRIDAESETFIAHTLSAEGFDASEDGTGRDTPLVPVAFDSKASGRNGFAVGDISPTLRAMGHSNSHQNAGGQVAVAFALRGREGGAMPEMQGDCAGALRAGNGGSSNSYVAGVGVRRLTPRECEILQGFPPNHTRIPWRGKSAEQCPDGPRYRAIGNSMAVPVMSWQGKRISKVNAILASEVSQ